MTHEPIENKHSAAMLSDDLSMETNASISDFPRFAPEDVEAWLIRHPDFFYQRPLALIAVNLPSEHQKKANVKSLLQYQTKLLRDLLAKKSDFLSDLTQNAIDNEQRMEKMLALASHSLSLIRHFNHAWSWAKWEKLVSEIFNLCGARLVWSYQSRLPTFPAHQVSSRISDEFFRCVQSDWLGTIKVLSSLSPVLAEWVLNSLSQQNISDTGSLALIPIFVEGKKKSLAWLCLFSQDSERFDPHAGNQFLRYLANFLAVFFNHMN